MKKIFTLIATLLLSTLLLGCSSSSPSVDGTNMDTFKNSYLVILQKSTPEEQQTIKVAEAKIWSESVKEYTGYSINPTLLTMFNTTPEKRNEIEKIFLGNIGGLNKSDLVMMGSKSENSQYKKYVDRFNY